jgi:hypothetical protein
MQQYTPQPPKDFKVTMDYKQSNIEKSQRSTQESIRVSGSATDATLIVTGLITAGKIGLLLKKHCTEAETTEYDKYEKALITEWLKWRKYFFKQRDIEETYKNLTQPF